MPYRSDSRGSCHAFRLAFALSLDSVLFRSNTQAELLRLAIILKAARKLGLPAHRLRLDNKSVIPH